MENKYKNKNQNKSEGKVASQRVKVLYNFTRVILVPSRYFLQQAKLTNNLGLPCNSFYRKNIIFWGYAIYPSNAALLHQVANQKSSPTALQRSPHDFACIICTCNCTSNQSPIGGSHNYLKMGKLQLQIRPINRFSQECNNQLLYNITMLHISINYNP